MQAATTRTLSEHLDAERAAGVYAQDGRVSIAGGAPKIFGTVTGQLHALRDWQIYYHRDGAWSNSLSSANDNNLPEGIRLVVDFIDNPQVNGKMTLDWVRPTFTVAKQ